MELIRYDKSVNAVEFLQILRKEFIPNIEKHFHDERVTDICSVSAWQCPNTQVSKHRLGCNSIKAMFYPGQSVELYPIVNWAYIEGKLVILKCHWILEHSEIEVGKFGNFKMLKALRKCYKKTSFLEKAIGKDIDY